MADYRTIYQILFLVSFILSIICFVFIFWAIKKYPSKQCRSTVKFWLTIWFTPVPQNMTEKDEEDFISYKKRRKIVMIIGSFALFFHFLGFITLVFHFFQLGVN